MLILPRCTASPLTNTWVLLLSMASERALPSGTNSHLTCISDRHVFYARHVFHTAFTNTVDGSDSLFSLNTMLTTVLYTLGE